MSPERDATHHHLSQTYSMLGEQRRGEEALAAYLKLIEESRLKKRQGLELVKP